VGHVWVRQTQFKSNCNLKIVTPMSLHLIEEIMKLV